MTWELRAACAGNPQPLWDDTVHGETVDERVQRIAAAKAVCARCTVRSECFADVDWSCDEGVRGGVLLPLKKTAYRPRSQWPAVARAAS